MIDLRSDTVTKPSEEMLAAMFSAKVGDDVFGEDVTVNALEAKMATLFNKEAALFCASGTMANQIAVKAHTQPMDEIILDQTAHIYYYETAGFAFHSGVSVKLVQGNRGIISATQIVENIQPDFDWLPKTSLVCLENTSNKGGGSCYELSELQEIYKTCQLHTLNVHIDGARLFNAIVAKKYTTQDIGANCDSISVCFSKGLGAPVGSILIGNKDFIRKARRIRKAFGGGMRQAGYLAAACLYALEYNVEQLEIDHFHAKNLFDTLQQLNYIKSVLPCETNILIFELDDTKTSTASLLTYLKSKEILAVEFGKNQIRMVFHLDISEEMVNDVIDALKSYHLQVN